MRAGWCMAPEDRKSVSVPRSVVVQCPRRAALLLPYSHLPSAKSAHVNGLYRQGAKDAKYGGNLHNTLASRRWTLAVSVAVRRRRSSFAFHPLSAVAVLGALGALAVKP